MFPFKGKRIKDHVQAPVAMAAGTDMVPAEGLQQGQGEKEPLLSAVAVLLLAGQPMLLLSSLGSQPAPAAPSHLSCSSSPVGKDKPGISCS